MTGWFCQHRREGVPKSPLGGGPLEIVFRSPIPSWIFFSVSRPALAVERRAYGAGERVGREGLFQEIRTFLQDSVVDDRVIRIARDVQQLHVGPHRADLVGHFATAQS